MKEYEIIGTANSFGEKFSCHVSLHLLVFYASLNPRDARRILEDEGKGGE